MTLIRPPAVAGLFYPARADELRKQIAALLAESDGEGAPPKAIIAPHAGFIYSGPVAASIYTRLRAAHTVIHRVVLLGPSHRVGFAGIAASAMTSFRTPLGDVPVDQEALATIRNLPGVTVLDQAHAREHSLEVQLPFLQMILDAFALVPLVVGDAPPEQVGRVLDALWGGPETLIVVSSDLSHYHDYATACRLDAATSQAIIELRHQDIGYDDACGRNPIRGLLWVAQRKGLRGELVDLRNSGDTAGPRAEVVGYGAYAFHG